MEAGQASEYRRAKKLLDAGKHPTFIGRDTICVNARNGGLIFFQHDGIDCAVAVVNARLNILLVLNVHPAHRGHGLGSAIVAFLQCNFVRALDSKVEYFAKLGYTPIGKPHNGKRFRTQVMVKSGLIELAGRVSRLLKPKLDSAEAIRVNV